MEQLRIGSPRLTALPRSLACFVHLKELFLVECIDLKHIMTPIEELRSLERLEIYRSGALTILPAGITLLKYMKVLAICVCPITVFAFHYAMDNLRDFTLVHTCITEITIPASACPSLEILDLSYNSLVRQVQVFSSTVVKLNLEGCSSLEHLHISKLVHLKILNIIGCVHVRAVDVEGLSSLEEILADRCWGLRMIQPWSHLERLNFISFSQYLYSCNRMVGPLERKMVFSVRAKHAVEFEKFMLNSFHNVTMLQAPADTSTTNFVERLKNVDSHSAILICFLTNESPFRIRFEASNSGAQSGVYETATEYSLDGLLLHMYMWTQGSKLLKDLDDHFYNEVAIYKSGKFHVGAGERGCILTFASEKEALKVFEHIMKWNMESHQVDHFPPEAEIRTISTDPECEGPDYFL